MLTVEQGSNVNQPNNLRVFSVGEIQTAIRSTAGADFIPEMHPIQTLEVIIDHIFLFLLYR